MEDTAKSFIREHPTLILTFCYSIITSIGVIYSYFFYNEFGINILKFADLSDFLLASILEPISVIIFLAIVVAAWIAFTLDKKLSTKLKGYGRWLKKMPKYFEPVFGVIAISIIAIMYVRYFAIANADEVKAGVIDEYTVRFSDSGELLQLGTLALLGSSSRFSYFYDLNTTRALVVPLENISFMQK